jgi:hypothetical protein
LKNSKTAFNSILLGIGAEAGKRATQRILQEDVLDSIFIDAYHIAHIAPVANSLWQVGNQFDRPNQNVLVILEMKEPLCLLDQDENKNWGSAVQRVTCHVKE